MTTEKDPALTAPTAPAIAPAAGTPPATPDSGATPDSAPKPPKGDDWAKIRAVEERARKEREDAKKVAKEAEEKMKGVAELTDLIEKAKSGDWKAREALLKQTGISYDELTKWKLTGGKADPLDPLKKEVEALRQQLESQSKEKQAEEEEQVKSSWNSITDSFKSTAGGDPTRYALLGDEINESWSQVEATLKEMARMAPQLTIEQAADRYEDYLRKLTQRRSKLLSPAVEDTAEHLSRPEDKRGRKSSQDSPRTLTNKHSSELNPAPASSKNPKTPAEKAKAEKERLARAANAIKW